MKDPIAMYLEILIETDLAYRVTNGGMAVWLPKSQIELLHHAGPGDGVEITMPEWLAEEKGFI